MPRYHERINPAYQVDFASLSSGKVVSSTKRRVRWRFGFSNRKAIEEGCAGTDCRGEEHEVTLTWSIISGKRLVICDNTEVHFSVDKKAPSKFVCSWPMWGCHVLQIVAFATPSLKSTPGFRQFDLLLDGVSVFELRQIYQLGGVSANARSISSRRTSQIRRQFQAQSRPQKEQDLISLHDLDNHEDRRMMDRSGSVFVPSHQPAVSEPVRSISTPGNLVYETNPIVGQQQVVSSPNPYLQQNPVHAVIEHHHIATNQPPTFNQVTGSFMGAYASPSSAGGATPEIKFQGEYSPTSVMAPSNHGNPFFQQSPSSPVSSKMPCTMAPSPTYTSQSESRSSFSAGSLQNVTEQSFDDDDSVDNLRKSLQKLVNIDDIRSEPEEQVFAKLSMASPNPPRAKDGKSRGMPPTSTQWYMNQNATLSQIKSVTSPRGASPVSVMRSSLTDSTNSEACAAAAAAAAAVGGSMVVYGSTPPPPMTNGPPPIQRVQGFGVGAQVTYVTY